MNPGRNSALEGIIAFKKVRDHDEYFPALVWGARVKCILWVKYVHVAGL